ncbi:YbjN domain-containing protein [Corynebacterium sp. 335C]
MSWDRNEALKGLSAQLDGLGVEHATAPDACVVTLPGTRKLKTTCVLRPAPDSLRVEAFVCRAPEDDPAAVHEWLLQRNRRMFGVGYALDHDGDVYLVGQLPARLGDADLDRLLGQVLEAADGDFNPILERGFAESIRKEWRWRIDHGESTRNLEQFRHLAPDDAPAPGEG